MWHGSSAKRINFITYRIGLCIFILFEVAVPSAINTAAVAAAAAAGTAAN